MALVSTPRTVAGRWILRGIGAVLLVAGAVLLVHGISGFNHDAQNLDPSNDPGFGDVESIGGGGILVVLGLAFLSAGFLRAQAGYAARETAPAVREFGSAFRGDDH